MSGEVRSPVEEALENQPFGALQLRVVLLCALVQAFDGFDLGTIGMAAPSLSKAWGVAPPAFTTAFVMSSVGILVGALLSGPLGDRFGRKPLLIISVGFIAVFSDPQRVRLVDPIDHRDAVPDRARHRRRHAGDGGADLRLQPDSAARHADHADVLRQHARRISRRPVGRADPADFRLAEHLPRRRDSAAAADPDPDGMAAGIAAIPDRASRRCAGDKGDPAAAQCQRPGGGVETGRCRAGQSGAAAVHRRTCDTDHPAVGGVLRQPPEHVSVQLLDAHGADTVGAHACKRDLLRQHVSSSAEFSAPCCSAP